MLTAAECRAAGLDPAVIFAPLKICKKLALAISGGGDSLALMLLYAAWRRDVSDAPDAIVYCVDHGLRPESGGEAAMVMDLAARLGLSARTLPWEGRKPKTRKQETARKARYALMSQAAARDEAVIVTAHHMDDQAETVLMRMAHGSGIGGLGGMRNIGAADLPRIYRPLLGVRRAALAALIARAGLEPADDPTNHDMSYERVRWRRALDQLKPMGLTPERLATLAHRAQRIDRLATKAMDDFMRSHQLGVDVFGSVAIPSNILRQAEDEIGIRLLCRLIGDVGGRTTYVLGSVESFWAALGGSLRGGKPLPARTIDGVRLVPGADVLHVFRDAGRIESQPVALAPDAPVIWDNRFQVCRRKGSSPWSIRPASEMTRAMFKSLTGREPQIPVAALRAAPLVCDGEGRVMALGTRKFVETDTFSVTVYPLTCPA